MMMVMMALVRIVAARYANCRRAKHHIRCVAGYGAAAAAAAVAAAAVVVAAVYAARIDGQRGRAQRIELVLQVAAAV